MLIELRPHKGIMRTTEGEIVEVEHAQWMVIATVGEYFHSQIGFLAQMEYSPLAAIPQFLKIPEGDRHAVMTAVSDAAGWDVGLVPPYTG